MNLENDPIDQILNADPESLKEPHKHPLLRHLHRATITRWMQKARLPALKVGRKWFVTDQIVRDFLKSTSKAAQQPRITPDRKVEIEAAFQAIGLKCPD